ncbi:sensor histidine kinase [Agrococcus jejuensis]|uniref:sensor histidine kinase n=1 Tax=Agrococcus jejuensis TaxID=399736 RepID=UPI0011A54DB2|nr:histidine kinase [Agrococcus jejuensis]
MIRSLTRAQLTFDVVVALVLGILLGGPSLLVSLSTPELPWVVLVGLGFGVLVALRRVAPMLTLLAALGMGAAFVGAELTALTPLWFQILVLLYTVGRWCDGLQRGLGAVVAVLGATLVGLWFVRFGYGVGTSGSIVEILLPFGLGTFGFALLFGLALVSGILVGEIVRSQGLAKETRLERERAEVEQERTGIARDMHDVVAHSLAVVIAQANGARYADSIDTKDESLQQIAQTASAALGDVRGLLERLRHAQAADPDASLAALPTLVQRVRAAGLDVEVREHGIPGPLPRDADIAAYRIVQEALTNALRHGDRTHPVLVSIVHGEHVELTVRNALRQMPGESGHGLVGMRERARIAGGHVDVGPSGGAWIVRAVLPRWEAVA